jgi:2-iminobutanoate/2-iminopropanoate deaminase
VRPCLAAVVAAPLLAAAACTIQERTDRATDGAAAPAEVEASRFINPWGGAEGPRAVRSGSLIWIWGMPGVVPGSEPSRLATGGAGAEARQALSNIEDVLVAAGAGLREVAQCTVFLADAADSTEVATVYAEYFPSPPIRTAVVSGPLALNARVEMECTAVVSDGV